MKGLDYQSAGVDMEAGDQLVDRIAPLARATHRPEVMAGVGGFAALFNLDLKRFSQPVLISGTDGVGTKVMLAHALDRLDTVGIDLVAMCVNDILTCGAEPLFFLDYMAMGKLDVPRGEALVRGIAEGCKQAGCALIGGETAEMPGVYRGHEFDLAGFSVGAANKPDLIDGKNIAPGDVILGLASSGLHSNGYSLARRVFLGHTEALTAADLQTLQKPYARLGPSSLGEVLLTPTKIYVKTILALRQKMKIKGMAHITGGGLPGNLPRVFPETAAARVRRGAWEIPPVFQALQSHGHVPAADMYAAFNMGIGFALVVDAADATHSLKHLQQLGEKAFVIGEVIARRSKENDFEFVD